MDLRGRFSRDARGGLLVLCAALVGAVLSSPASACDSSTCALLTRGQSGVLARGAFRVDVSFRYTDQGTKLRGGGSTDDVVRPKVALEHRFVWPAYHREIGGDESFLQIDLAYGLTSRAMVLASAPLRARRSYDVSHFGRIQQYGTRGLGDALVGLRYAVGATGVVAGFSIKLPTGDHRVTGDFDGSILDPTMQPGSGSVDVVGSLQYAGHVRALALDWSLAGSYQRNGRNDLDYRFGDETVATLGASRPVVGRLSASFQAKLFHKDRNEYLDASLPSSGVTFVYVTPGLRLGVPGGVSIYGFLQVPAYRYVHEAQLAPRIAFLTGASKTF